MATLWPATASASWLHKRAAKAVFRLDRHVTPLIETNTFKAVPGIGPTTDRIARELIFDGKSAFVEEAIRAAGKEEAIASLRAFRQHFISRATMEEVLARRGAPSRARYRGDFQMHSIWSDGSETLESIVEACLARGYQCAGMTDHSYGLPIAGGMSMAQVVEQHAAIDDLNAIYKGRFRMVKGSNNILTEAPSLGAARAAPVRLSSPLSYRCCGRRDDQTSRMSRGRTAGCLHLGLRRSRSRRRAWRLRDQVFVAAASASAIEIDGRGSPGLTTSWPPPRDRGAFALDMTRFEPGAIS